MIIPTCPVCLDHNPKSKLLDSPYWICDSCGLGFQNPMPPKLFEAQEEKGQDGRSGGHNQSKDSLAVAKHLAEVYYHNWISKIPLKGNACYKVMDLGAKYPWFAYCLKIIAQAEAYGLDGMDMDDPGAMPIAKEYEQELGIPMLLVDFEKVTPEMILGKTEDANRKFDSLSMIHVFEHMYDPYQALINLRALIQDDGVFLVRVPDCGVPGFESHLGPRHYGIHPYFWCVSAFTKLIERSKTFKIAETYPLGGGVRDYILKPIP